ncbi:MAG: hypothetical protein ACI8WB_004068 [Phenylobacterium sp.]|jgi:hypothetical protein
MVYYRLILRNDGILIVRQPHPRIYLLILTNLCGNKKKLWYHLRRFLSGLIGAVIGG